MLLGGCHRRVRSLQALMGCMNGGDMGFHMQQEKGTCECPIGAALSWHRSLAGAVLASGILAETPAGLFMRPLGGEHVRKGSRVIQSLQSPDVAAVSWTICPEATWTPSLCFDSISFLPFPLTCWRAELQLRASILGSSLG